MFFAFNQANKDMLKDAKLFKYSIGFKIPVCFKGIQLKTREGLILQLQYNQQYHFAEICPLPGFSCETLQQAQLQITNLLESCLEKNKLYNNHLQHIELYPSVHFALDCALHNIPLTPLQQKQVITPLLQGDNATVIAQYKKLNKPDLIKLKVARQNTAQDIQLFNTLTDLNERLLIRCDANQAWDKSQASEFFANITPQSIDYIEEPTASTKQNIELAEAFNIALALDETLQDSNFLYQHHPCYKALVLKPTLIGSLQRLQYFIDIAQQHRLQVSISSSFESPLGLQQLQHLAAKWSQQVEISMGLDTLKFFEKSLFDKMLTDKSVAMAEQIQTLECVWQSNSIAN